MKSRYSSLILVLPILTILGVQLFLHTEAATATANVHHDRFNHAISQGESGFVNSHHLGLSHGNRLHLHVPQVREHFLHLHGNNGRTKTWQKAKWTTVSKWDEQARQDMNARIVIEGWNWVPRAETFGRQTNWIPGWELRWWSYSRTDGHDVWVYHVRSKSSGQRYTSLTNHIDGKLQKWEVVK